MKKSRALPCSKGCLVAESLFYAVLLGGALGVLYDVFRFPRLIFRDRFFLDFLFWVISAICVFCYYLIFTGGSIRILNLVFVLVGFLLYIYTLGYVTKMIEVKLSSLIRKQFKKIKNALKSFKKVLQSRLKVYYNMSIRKLKGNNHGTEKQLSEGSTGDIDGIQSEKEE